ncbi:MAG: hypothetical protein K2X45_13075, partial [Phreatobacter sp.]|nr:hypothetical protein [Phreatobacter sp.]
PVTLPETVPPEFQKDRTADELRMAMAAMITDAAAHNSGRSYQIQTSMTEMVAASRSHYGVPSPEPASDMPFLHSPATVRTMQRFMDAAMLDALTGAQAFGRLKASFGPHTATAYVADAVPKLETLDPKYAAIAKRSQAEQDFMTPILQHKAAKRVLDVHGWGIKNTTPTRALHLSIPKAIKIIDGLPANEVRQAYADLRDVNRNNATRVADRHRMNDAVAIARDGMSRTSAPERRRAPEIER